MAEFQEMNLPTSRYPRVVIIGGGFGGIALAHGLKGAPYQVVLIDRNNFHTFQPLLYQVATAGLEPDAIAFPLRKIFHNRREFVFRMAEVTRIDPARRAVETSIGSLTYDHLVVATGSTTNFFGNRQFEANTLSLKSLSEAMDLRSLVLQNFEEALLVREVAERDALMSFVIVGGGPTGVELAGALAELRNYVLPVDYPELDLRRMQIHLLEAGPCLLKAMSPEARDEALRELERRQVSVWLNTGVTEAGDGRVVTATGKVIPSRTVIWTAGVKGAPVAGLEQQTRRGRLVVDELNRVRGLEGVYALGDVALMESEDFPQGHPMVAQTAIQQGRLLARNLRRHAQNPEWSWYAFRYKDLGSMATIGRSDAVADIGRMHFKGLVAWVLWLVVHLLQLMGFRNRAVVLVNWIWNYWSYDRASRLIVRTNGRRPHAIEAAGGAQERAASAPEPPA